MANRFRSFFFAKDYRRQVIDVGKCLLEAPPPAYRPLFSVVDFPSHGFRTAFRSWIVKRTLHAMSKAEYHAILLCHAPGLRVTNICEQFALDPSLTREFATDLGVKHPSIRGVDIVMSTDLVVCWQAPDGRIKRHAVAVKQAAAIDSRSLEKLAIEQAYWAARRTPWSLLLDTDIPSDAIAAMKLLVGFADSSNLACEQNTVDRVHAWLSPHLAAGAPLRNVCARCDAAHELAPGTSLAVSYHLATRGQLVLGEIFLPQTYAQIGEAA